MKDHKELQETLIRELKDLTEELKTIATQHQESGDWLAIPDPQTGEADQNVEADSVEEWNQRRATVAQLETRYFNIKRALQKFEDDVFGICEVCGHLIEDDRLKANPSARTCKIDLEKERELAE